MSSDGPWGPGPGLPVSTAPRPPARRALAPIIALAAVAALAAAVTVAL